MTKTTLRKLGFCGADDSISPKALGLIYNSYPFVEFGVLFRPDKEGQPRYASKEWVDEVSKVCASSGMTLAAHLCGKRVNECLDGDDTFLATLYPMGFRRVQINATAVNGVDTSYLAEAVPTVAKLMAKHENLEFIIQKNEETKLLWSGLLDYGMPSNVTMLLDESKGTGVLSKSWPEPPKDYDIGYAGGIGPANIEQVLKDVMDSGKGRDIWIDMESSLRTIDKDGKDVFDANKCFQCIDAVCKAGIYSYPKFLS